VLGMGREAGVNVRTALDRGQAAVEDVLERL
jgi:hypothetical protein